MAAPRKRQWLRGDEHTSKRSDIDQSAYSKFLWNTIVFYESARTYLTSSTFFLNGFSATGILQCY